MKNYSIETILAPTDFSETANKALQHSIELTKKTGAKLILANIVELTGYTFPVEMVSLGLVTEQMMDASKENLKNLAEKIKTEHGLQVKQVSFSGNVYDNIIRAAHLHNADLIVMGTHGTSGIKEWLFGSNAFSVVNNTTIPVLTVNLHSETNGFKKIVFPFNENLLTLKKFEHVIALAKLFNATVLLFGYTESKMTSDFISLRVKGKELAEKFVAENIKCTFSMTMGEDYADEILLFATEEKADMVTVATNRNQNFDKAFKLNTGRKLVNHSEIPVLSIPVE